MYIFSDARSTRPGHRHDCERTCRTRFCRSRPCTMRAMRRPQRPQTHRILLSQYFSTRTKLRYGRGLVPHNCKAMPRQLVLPNQTPHDISLWAFYTPDGGSGNLENCKKKKTSNFTTFVLLARLYWVLLRRRCQQDTVDSYCRCIFSSALEDGTGHSSASTNSRIVLCRCAQAALCWQRQLSTISRATTASLLARHTTGPDTTIYLLNSILQP